MQIVLAAHSLVGLGGSETYVVTISDHLQRLGHDVWLHSPELGRAAEAAQRLGVRVCEEHRLPQSPDALIVQDGVVACELADRYPLAPQVFVAHSDIFDLQLPPQLPGLVSVVVVLYDRVERRIAALALPHEIVRLSQPIDVERFKSSRPLRDKPRVAMTVGNYVHGPRLELLMRACERARIELRQVGVHGPSGAIATERVYDDADIVFGKARVILEAMACGRAAYVFDHNGGDGWVTPESYERLAPDNFGGQTGGDPISEERLTADLAAYDARMGTVNRDLVVARHAASKHAAALVGVVERVVPRSAPIEAPMNELARLVRMYHRVDMQAFALHVANTRLAERVHELEKQRAHELAAHQAAHDTELSEERRSHEEVAAQLEALTTTRRWRTMQAALAPADRLRSWRRSRRRNG